ncbi:MAG: glycosyl hydrolase [Luteolibacter sp.]
MFRNLVRPLLIEANVIRNRLTVLISLVLVAASLRAVSAAAAETDWPPIDQPQTKAWTRWWWHGNEVTVEDLTAQMEKYAAAGLGGLEITPIYERASAADQFINYLAPQWVDRFVHVLHEAERLGMEIDMSTGTGWPFGGQWVDADTACARSSCKPIT